MSFARKVWRLLVGIKDALALAFFLLFFTLLFAALSARPNPGSVNDGALLLKLDGTIVEEVATIDPLSTLLSRSLPTREYAARDLVRAIDSAAEDKRIKAVALDLTTFTGGGQVSVKEVAEALARFRAAGKPVSAYALAYTDDAMMLAAQANEVWVDPMGGVAIRGPGGTILFYADALKRFGVTAHVYQAGDYKGTGEPYANSAMSPEFRQNTETYIGQLWDEYRAAIVKARPEADFDAVTSGIEAALTAQGGDMARLAVNAGLADTIGTYAQWGAHMARLAGEDKWDKHPAAFAHTELDTYVANVGAKEKSGKKSIGVVTIAGAINDSEAGPGTAGAARIERLLDDALDDDLAALVVRIDSPGGTVTGSETIRRALMRYREKKIPVVVSMANYAASGGYWIATAGERIFAEPETVTGSIGVVLMVPSFEGLLKEYGVNPERIAVTPLSGQPDVLGGFSPEADALLRIETQSFYRRFTGLVGKARKLSPAQIDAVAQGRVWTGGAARQLGLVDQFGGLDDALAYAAQQAGLKDGDWGVKRLADPVDPFEALVAGMLTGEAAEARQPLTVSAAIAGDNGRVVADVLRDLEQMVATPGVQARCLGCVIEGQPSREAEAAAPRGWSAVLALLAGR
ncbi:signal peptide peptidase SppA [Aurantiacibacter xanthus]|uniref:Signal peptide peptidase SppA n=1 Tax=Aurantiacibacter xanthus TaxID=1784712 RepID=A0A3A1P3H1_9SPHN|nr:signal peptide peptidase SppA [Aurantiacibacter xanthus]RIV80495.1 signal peptide peptidase SppA [Aurantiacibacter xanthus]